MTRITPEEIAMIRGMAEMPAVNFGTPLVLQLCDALESSYAELDALKSQLEERQVVVPEQPEEKRLWGPSQMTKLELWNLYVAQRAKLDAKEKELETERNRLAACGVAALGYFDGCHDDYKSASLTDVLRLRDRCAQLAERRVVGPDEVTVPREYLEMLQSAANRFCSSCRDNNASCSMTARHFGGTGCGAWKLDGTRINALRSGEAGKEAPHA